MFHFAEGAIDSPHVTAQKSLHALSVPIGGNPTTVVLISEPSERAAEDIAKERLKAARLSLRGFRGEVVSTVPMGGTDATSFGWEFFDEAAGRVAAHQVLASVQGRTISLSATFPLGVREKGIQVLHQLAQTIRWRAL